MPETAAISVSVPRVLVGASIGAILGLIVLATLSHLRRKPMPPDGRL